MEFGVQVFEVQGLEVLGAKAGVRCAEAWHLGL